MTPEAARRAVLRTGFGIGDLIAPRTAARCAARMWFTVPARRPSVLPEPEGGTAFVVQTPIGTVRGRSWGQGPAVYFVHGWGGTGAQCHPYVPALVAGGLRVVTFDAPGHGSSAQRRRTHAVELAGALEAVQRSQGAADSVIAHSLGAVALMLAMRTGRTSPRRVVLVAPLARVDGQLDGLARVLRLGARARAGLDREVLSTTGVTVGDLALDGLARLLPGRDAVVVHDRDDTFAPYADTAALVAGWPGARLVTTKGLGHVRLLGDAAVVETVVPALVELVRGVRHECGLGTSV